MGQKGFSFIELSVVLLIMSVVLGGSLAVGINRAESSQIEITNRRMDKIMEAIGVYIATTNNIPCPADPALALSNASASVADPTARCNNVRQTACTANCGSALRYRVGSVPTTTLAIPDEYMFDGWGRRITYAVDTGQDVPVAGVSIPMPPSTLVGGEINIHGPSSSSVRTLYATIALVSHGPTGHGAWPRGGGATRIDSGLPAASLEQENADTPSNGKSFSIIFRQVAKSSDFGHIVRYYTRPALMNFSKGFIDTALCTLVTNTNTNVNYTVAPKLGPVGCLVEPSTTSYNAECLIRQRQLATFVKCY